MNRSQIMEIHAFCKVLEGIVRNSQSLCQVFSGLTKNSQNNAIASYFLRTMYIENLEYANDQMLYNYQLCVNAYQTRKNLLNYGYQVKSFTSGFHTLVHYMNEFEDDPYHVCGVLLNEKASIENDKSSGIP